MPLSQVKKSSRWTMVLTSMLLTVCVLASVASLVDWYWSMPLVYVSAQTKKCVRVETIPLQKKWSCADILNNPEVNYTQVWVK